MALVILVKTLSAQSIDTVNFTCGISTVQYAGQTYHTVKIGNQCWLKENLNVGSMIQVSKAQTDNKIIEKYCYNDDSINCTKYGGLYQWDEAMKYSSESAQGICPSGWHIPASDEFQILETTINLDGNALKAKGQGLGDGDGTNKSGFSAMLAGFRHFDGYFDGLSIYSRFWSSTEGDPTTAYFLRLTNSGIKIFVFPFLKDFGFSVRCVKD
jgi:uncharacterized protein (TIGR02145 family)